MSKADQDLAQGKKQLETTASTELMDLTSEAYASDVLPDSLVRLTTELSGGYEPYAPVRMPNREELTVRLVNISMLQRLDELRSDISLYQNFLWAAIGGIIGFATNVLTSNQPVDAKAALFLALLCVFAAVFTILVVRGSKRAEAVRQRIYDDKPKPNSEVADSRPSP